MSVADLRNIQTYEFESSLAFLPESSSGELELSDTLWPTEAI